MDSAERLVPWINDTPLDFGGVKVELCIPPELYERQSAHDYFILGKSREMIVAMMPAVSDITIANVVDVEVYKGGSVVFLNEVFQPRHLLGIDSNPAEIPPLLEYCSLPDRGRCIVSISA